MQIIIYKFYKMFYCTACEKWRLTRNVSAENGIFYPLSSVADCMNLCQSISNCVAIDIWSTDRICSIHLDANDLSSNVVTAEVSQFVLDRSCEVSKVTAGTSAHVATTQTPTLPTSTKTTSATTRRLTEPPGIIFYYNVTISRNIILKAK